MSNDSNGYELQHHQKGLQIKQEDKFFRRLMSKETSKANSSCRVYYGGASGAVPFMWESHPGTPKHPSSDAAIPPLTPPPSYYSSFNSKSKHKKTFKPTLLMTSIFPKLITARKTQASPSSSRSSSSSLSSWSSLHDSGSSPLPNSSMNQKLFHRQMKCFSCARSPVHNCIDDDGDEHEVERLGSPTSTLCFGVKPRNLNGLKGCRSMITVKKSLLAMVSHGSGQGSTSSSN